MSDAKIAPPVSGQSKPYDVAIVSVYGRGDWLACELAKLGWLVALIDATSALAEARGVENSSAALSEARIDAEGPFGFFETPLVSESQRASFVGDESAGDPSPRAKMAPLGACVWPPGGPIECRSEMTAYQLAAREQSAETRAYLRWSEDSADAARLTAQLRRKMARQSFAQTWLAAFAHQLTSVYSEEASEALSVAEGPPCALLAPFWTRNAGGADGERSLAECERLGAHVFRVKNGAGLRLGDTPIETLDGASAHAFVWALTSAETASISPNAVERLFPSGPVEPNWRWMRCRFSAALTPSFVALPPWTAIVVDPFLPWSIDNLFVLRKRDDQGAKGQFDVWLKLPSDRAARNSVYLAEVAESVRGAIAARLPGTDVKIERLPHEAQAGPARSAAQPVFERERLRTLKRCKDQRLHFDGPETWQSLDANGAFARQLEILAVVKAQKLARDARKQKIEAREEKARARAHAAKPAETRPDQNERNGDFT